MEKIYGVYTGDMDMSSLDKMHEIDVWKSIESMGSSIFWVNHDAADGRITLTDVDREKLNERQYSLEYLVYYTRKFGVTFSREPQAGKHVERSEDYNAWFKFWNNVVSSWSTEKLQEFIKRKKNGQDFSYLLPKTNWKGEEIVESELNV